MAKDHQHLLIAIIALIAVAALFIAALVPDTQAHRQPLLTSPPTPERFGNSLTDPAERSFDIPAMPLDKALVAWIMTTGVQAQGHLDPLAAIRSRPLQGRFTPAEALNQLFTDTGCIIKPFQNGEIVNVDVKCGEEVHRNDWRNRPSVAQ